MAKNTFSEGDRGLVNLNYSDLLSKILTRLEDRSQNPFSKPKDSNQLAIALDDIAFDIASVSVENPLANSASSAKSATVNFSRGSSKEFVKQVQQIRDCLQQHLASFLAQHQTHISLKYYLTTLATDLQYFQGKVNNNLGFTYDFEKQYSGLQKQRLSFQKNHPGSHKLLRLHKLTITVENTGEFQQQLQASLANWINMDFSESEGEELNYILEDLVENSKSDIYSLARLMDTEALGKLQRGAKIKYLEYLREHLGEHRDIVYLQDLIRRLKLLEYYINDIEKDDGHYEVNYAGVKVNYRDIFARSDDAFDCLPIIPQIAGYLGEIKDDSQLGKIQFIFGLKLKLNGSVPTAGSESVLDYYLNLLDASSND